LRNSGPPRGEGPGVHPNLLGDPPNPVNWKKNPTKQVTGTDCVVRKGLRIRAYRRRFLGNVVKYRLPGGTTGVRGGERKLGKDYSISKDQGKTAHAKNGIRP